jgi:regulator of replication initiation timing
VLAPITPEAVRARVPVGKENIRSNGEETQRLRLENERLREKASKLSKENKGLKSQYNFLLSMDRSGSRGDVGQLTSNHDQLQAALENGLEKPSKIRRRHRQKGEMLGYLVYPLIRMRQALPCLLKPWLRSSLILLLRHLDPK